MSGQQAGAVEDPKGGIHTERQQWGGTVNSEVNTEGWGIDV